MELIFEITPDELPVYLAETDEQLQLLDEGLLQLEREGESMELLQALFRAAHTLKGAAGMIGHKRMVAVTHALETAFDGLRKQVYSATPDLIEICFRAIDDLRKLREEVVTGRASAIEIEKLTDRFSELVLSHTPDDKRSQPAARPQNASSNAVPSPAVAVEKNTPAVQPQLSEYKIQADISPQSIASSARAFQLSMALQELGQIIQMDPSQEIIETAKPVFRLFARLATDKTLQAIRKELESVSEVDKLTVEKVEISKPEAEKDATKAPVESAASKPETVPGETESTRASSSDKSQAATKFTADKTVRTSVERLDNLMNLVGELITDRNRLNQIRSTLETRFRGDEEVETLAGTIAHISRITDQLQGEVMGIRMVPIANVFNKFPRMVRDLSNKLGKKIDLVVRGEDTELDRSLIELINDPLIHLLRNAVDHGIESLEKRRADGKSEQARVLLTARHEQGRIIITVEDDGGGIDPQKLKVKAVQKGFLSQMEADNLHDDEAINLIFFSGFSTASVLSDVSGRGVGLDIVRNNVQRLNGSLMVESWVGKGTRFQVILPLTLAIVQTLLVKVGVNRLAIPLVTVMSTLGITSKDIHTINNKPVIILRNKVLPLLLLADTFHFKSIDEGKYKYVVVVSSGKQQIGLLVDRLLGEEEVVVKSLGPLIGEINGISSAAILGDGHVILIVDVQDLGRISGASQFGH